MNRNDCSCLFNKRKYSIVLSVQEYSPLFIAMCRSRLITSPFFPENERGRILFFNFLLIRPEMLEGDDIKTMNEIIYNNLIDQTVNSKRVNSLLSCMA